MALALVSGVTPLRVGVVDGHSMEPTLPNGSLFFYDRTFYRRHPIHAGDVVVLNHQGCLWVKRVFAVAGDRFWSWREEDANQNVRHDPIRASQLGHFAAVAAHLRATFGVDERVVRLQVPKGAVFVVGDCAWSVDSRQIGPLDAGEIVGKVVPVLGKDLGTIPDSIERSFPQSAPPAQAVEELAQRDGASA